MNTATPLVDAAVNDAAFEDKSQPHTDWITAYAGREIEAKLNEAVEKIIGLEAEVAKWKSHFIALGAVTAQKYGAGRFGENCLHYLHYDMLKEAGARMDDFHRCGANDDGPPEGLGKTP